MEFQRHGPYDFKAEIMLTVSRQYAYKNPRPLGIAIYVTRATAVLFNTDHCFQDRFVCVGLKVFGTVSRRRPVYSAF